MPDIGEKETAAVEGSTELKPVSKPEAEVGPVAEEDGTEDEKTDPCTEEIDEKGESDNEISGSLVPATGSVGIKTWVELKLHLFYLIINIVIILGIN